MTTYLTCIAILLILLSAVLPAFAEEQDPNLNQLVTGNNAFAFDLYSILKEEKGNLFLSPYSISSALAMTYGGARGDTAKEMAEVLRFGLGADRTHPAFAELDSVFREIQKKGQVQLHIANSLWPQKDYRLLPEYLTLIKQHYGVSITPVDYVKADEQARKIINTWVEDKIKDKIKDIIRQGDLNPLTTLVLVNAIYFKGNWASQFDPRRTAESDFSLSEDRKIHVSMMYQKGEFGYGEIKGGKLLELPYVGNHLSMVIVPPEKAWFQFLRVPADLGYQGIVSDYLGENIRIPHRKPRKSKKNPNTFPGRFRASPVPRRPHPNRSARSYRYA